MLHPRPRKKSINTVNANNSARRTLESNKLVLNGFDVEEKNDGCHRAKPTKKRKSFNKRECSDPERIKIKMLDDFQKRAQLNSVSVMHDGYYSSQPAIIGLVGRMNFLLGSFLFFRDVYGYHILFQSSGAIAFRAKQWFTS
ncbi:hypothetical protein JHK87_008505 [Glycine soja]|nr:hypothetical protein JHK87_008505 [Glycine soja]